MYSPPIGFVGRGEELRYLESHARDLASTGDRVDLISGEPGIGKSALIREYRRRVDVLGVALHEGRCIEGFAPPMWPWIEITKSVLRGVDRAAFERETDVDVLRALVPDPPAERTDGVDPSWVSSPLGDSARFGVFYLLKELFRFASSTQPVAMVIEDLHWADEASLRFLSYLVPELGDLRLHLVCSFRDTGVGVSGVGEARNRAFSSCRADIESYSGCSNLVLEGLSYEDVQTLVAESNQVGESSKRLDEQSRQVYSLTDGNPLYVSAILQSPTRSGGSKTFDATTAAARERFIYLIDRYIAQLNPQHRSVIEAAAVLGSDHSISTLLEVVGLEDWVAVSESLDVAAQYALMLPVGDGTDAYRFRHAVISEAVLGLMSATERTRLHARCAQVLERAQASGREVASAELLHHFAASEIVHGVEPTVRWAVAAANAALEIHAPEDAIRFVKRGLRSVGKILPHLEAELRAASVRAELELGPWQMQNCQNALAATFDAITRAGSSEVARSVLRSLPWPIYLQPEAGAGVETALRLAAFPDEESAEGLHDAIIGSYSASRMLISGLRDPHADMESDRAAVRAEGRGDCRTAGLIRSLRGSAFALGGHSGRALVEARKTYSLMTVAGDDQSVVFGALLLSGALGHLHLDAEAEDLYRRAIPIALRHPYDAASRTVISRRCMALFREADWDNLEQTALMNLNLRPPMPLYDTVLVRAAGHLEQDRVDEACEMILTIANPTVEYDQAMWLVSHCTRFYLRSGDRRLLSSFPGCVAAFERAPGISRSEAMRLLALAVLAYDPGDRGSVAELLPQIDPRMLDLAHEPLGDLHAYVGEYATAREIYLEGIDAHPSDRPLIGWLYYRLACLSRETGEVDEESWFEKARSHAAKYGLLLLQRRIREATGRRDDPDTDGVAGGPQNVEVATTLGRAGLTPREVQVLAQLAQGHTDAEIASELSLTSKTVSNYVSRIFSKVGVGNRTEAALFAVKAGLGTTA